MMIGEIVLTVLAGWFAIGAVIATLFVIFGVGRVDHAAQGASFLFRPIIFLGCIVLWPAILVRWFSGKKINEPIDEG